MQVSELLRKLADLVAQAETEGTSIAAPAQQAAPEQGEVVARTVKLTPVQVPQVADGEGEPMVSPLQQQHEMMKKSMGDDEGEYEETEECEGDDEDAYQAELDSMRRIAGIGEQQQTKESKPEMEVNPRKTAAQEFHKSRKSDSE